MLSYSNNEYDEAISNILDKGIKDLERISKSRIVVTSNNNKAKNYKSKNSLKRIITDSNSNYQPTQQIVKTTATTQSSYTTYKSVNDSLMGPSYYSNNITLTEGRKRETNPRNILKKTKTLLNNTSTAYHHTKINSTKRSISSKRSQPHLLHNTKDSNYKTEMQLLEYETNRIWKDKYSQLKENYQKMKEMLQNEKKKNSKMTEALNQLKKKESDIVKLFNHQIKLEQVTSVLQSQYDESELHRQKQLETIRKHQNKLGKLRIGIQSLTPNQFKSY